MSIDLGITVNVNRDVQPFPTGDFRLPLILGMSGSTPQDQFDEFSTLNDLLGTYDETNHPHIADHARAMFGPRTNVSPSRVAVLNVARATPSVGDLSTALGNNADEPFFYIASTHRNGTNPDSDDIGGDRTDVSDWAEANDRVYIATNEIGETVADQETFLNGITNERTYYLAMENTAESEDNLDNPVNAAIAGVASAFFPGSINFKWQVLEDFTASDFSQSEVDTIEAAGGNVFVTSKGRTVTSEGVSTDPNLFVDIPIIQLWLKDRLEKNIVDTLADAEQKVGFDSAGILQVEDSIQEVFEFGAEEDLFVINQVIVDMPAIEDVSDSDKANRILSDVSFEAKLVGAINEITVTGTLVA